MGFATTIQLWGLVPSAIIAVSLLVGAWRQPSRSLRAPSGFVAGVGLGVAVVCLPFLVAAGLGMVRMTILDQIGRPSLDFPLVARLQPLEVGFGTLATGLAGTAVVAGGVAVSLAVAAIARFVPVARLWIALFVAQVAVVLAGPVFFPHYAAWSAPAGAILVGVAIALVVDRSRAWRAASAVAWTGLLVLAIGLGIADVRRVGVRIPTAALRAAIASATCVAADEPTLLILTGSLGTNLERGCRPLVVDPTGVAYDTDRGGLPPGAVGASRSHAPRYQSVMLSYYGGADASMFQRLYSDGLTDSTWMTLRCNLPDLRRVGALTLLLARTGSSGPPKCP